MPSPPVDAQACCFQPTLCAIAKTSENRQVKIKRSSTFWVINSPALGAALVRTVERYSNAPPSNDQYLLFGSGGQQVQPMHNNVLGILTLIQTMSNQTFDVA